MGVVSDGRGAGSERRLVLDSYAPLSRNVSGELEKVEEQHADNRRVIERLGGVLGVELTDDDLSAWKPKVRRPDWERLLARLASGESDGAVVWHVDRLLRLPRDLERLLEFSDRGLMLGCAHGQWDLADPNDRFILRVEVAHACRSSDDASRRIRRRFETLRRNGVTHGGGRSFGFAGRVRVGGERGRREEVPAEVVVAERAAIREATAGVLTGASYAGVAAQWNAAGLRTAGGKVWIPQSVRAVLSRARNAGLVEHDGVVVGQMPGDPIVERADFEAVAGVGVGTAPGSTIRGALYRVGSAALRAVPASVDGAPAYGDLPRWCLPAAVSLHQALRGLRWGGR